MTNEVLEARIYAGIHFRNPDVQSADLGREIARYAHKRCFAANPLNLTRGAAFGPLADC